MRIMRRFVVMTFVVVLIVFAPFVLMCVPAANAPAAPPADACVSSTPVDAPCLLVALAGSQVADDVCATVEELLPFVAEILASRVADGGREHAMTPGCVWLASNAQAVCATPVELAALAPRIRAQRRGAR